MKAMILAAGLGTRLRPLTDTRPKALVEINGRTLVEITLSRLRSFGVDEVIVNVHHFADMIAGYLKSKNNFGMRIEISREDDLLLDTGGGLKKAAWFFLEGSRNSSYGTGSQSGEPFVLYNVDVLTNIDLRRMLQFHIEHHALASLAVQSRASSRLLVFNDELQLCGRRIKNQESVIPRPRIIPTSTDDIPASPGVIPSAARNPGKSFAEPSSDQASPALPENAHSPLSLAFSGIHVISPRLLPMLTEDGVFSIIDAYLRLAGQSEKILAFRADDYYWRDLGKPTDLSQAALDLQQKVLQL